MIEVIGVPFDLCGKRLGSRLGPAALRLAGLSGVIGGLGQDARDSGDFQSDLEERGQPGLRNFDAYLQCVTWLKKSVDAAIRRNDTPIVLGGDHSIAAGSVSAALEVFDGDLALLWIDAHADCNTPATSPSGNLHGMPIAALQGYASGVDGKADAQWRKLVDEVVPTSRLLPDRCAWYGLRDVEPAERDLIRRTPGDLAITMQDVDRFGVVETMRRFDGWIRNSGAKQLWISFDVDSLDPILAPGTGTAVRGGLTYREAHLIAELLREFLDTPDCPYRLAGLDIVETNPLFDSNNETAKMAVEWVGSLFGKSILGVR